VNLFFFRPSHTFLELEATKKQTKNKKTKGHSLLFLGVKQGDGVTQGFWGARLTMTLLVMPMQGLCL